MSSNVVIQATPGTLHPGLHLGEHIGEDGRRNGTACELEPAQLTTHGVILGMTGSGKTGLGIVLLEEALLHGIPTLIIDPKGDMGNLLLGFPALRPEDFRPWIDEAEARRAGLTPDEFAARTADSWRTGLADWGLGPADVQRLRESARFTLFTPGSAAGIPVDVVGSLVAPDPGTPEEARNDEIEGFVSGLLALVGRSSDPLSSPDHILLSNLIARAWSAGQNLDLPTLVTQVATPPIRKLGVFDLDTFMPPRERMALAVQLNALLASPSFAPWLQGVPLDMERLLHDERGRPRAAILYLAHLSEPERQFITTLVLSRLVSWMRTQPGTSELRALVYMDEVAGFAPPTAMPPSKKPILTILKQARAHGIGMVLATQNPVDLDYKALSNAGTWLIGRLQTERDQARVLEGMRSAAGDVDPAALGTAIGALGRREFILHTARGGAPRRFTTRWALSFLRGPLTRVEIERLMADAPERSTPSGDVASQPSTASATPAASAAASAASPPGDGLGLAPAPAAGIRVRWLDASAPWAAEIGAQPGGTHWQAAVAARVHLRFDDTAADVDHTETYECIYFPLDERADPASARPVDYDERDLLADAPADATYEPPRAPIERAAYFRNLERQLRDWLQRSRSIEVFGNRELKLYSRVGESRDAFAERCRATADQRADAEAAALRERVAQRHQRLQQQLREAEDRVRELTVDSRERMQHELIAGAGTLLSLFLGGRGGGLRSLSGAASRRSQTRRTRERLDTAQNRAEDVATALQQLEQDLADELAAIQDRWDAAAARIETRRIPLEQSDVSIEETVLLWVPVS